MCGVTCGAWWVRWSLKKKTCQSGSFNWINNNLFKSCHVVQLPCRNLLKLWFCTTLGARGFLSEEPRSGDKQSIKWWREKRERRWENLWLPTTVDWSYRANRFELGSRSDPASWLEEPYSVLWLAVVNWQVCCYWLLDNNWSHDVDCHMIVRFASPTTRGFLSPLLSFFAATENLWDQGSFVLTTILLYICTHYLDVTKGRFTRCDFVPCNLLTIRLWHEKKVVAF